MSKHIKMNRSSQKYYRSIIRSEAASYASAIKNDYERINNGINLVMEQAAMPGLILILCAIDYLKSFHYGLKAIDSQTFTALIHKYKYNPQHKYLMKLMAIRKKLKRGPDWYYMHFLNIYLHPLNPKYNISEIYKSLRCGLIHNYSDKIFRYDFIDNRDSNIGDRTREHLTKRLRNKRIRILFNIDVFYRDYINMCNIFWGDVLKDKCKQMNIHDIKSYVGFMTVIPE